MNVSVLWITSLTLVNEPCRIARMAMSPTKILT